MSVTGAGQHWLYAWMDELEVVDATSARERLKESRYVSRLLEHAADDTSDAREKVPLVGSVLAGPGLDMSLGVCHNLSCRKDTIDYDFGVPLHYFDYVVMQGPPRKRATQLSDPKNRHHYSDLIRSVAADVEVMAYLRKIGLANYSIFVDKDLPCYCTEHFTSYARELGFGHLVEDAAINDLAARISREGGVHVFQTGPRAWAGRLIHPRFSTTYRRLYNQKTRPKKQHVAAELIRKHVFEATVETYVSRHLGTPLAALSQPDFLWTEQASGEISASDVALELRIPVLDSLTTEQIIKLREEEYHHFERFRQVLTEAITKAVDKNHTLPATVLAETVWRDTLRPAAYDIERRIAASNRSFVRKITAGVSVVAMTGAVGAVAGFPLIAAAGATAAAVSLPVAQLLKYFDDRQQIELNDMYFLWKARKLAVHNHE